MILWIAQIPGAGMLERIGTQVPALAVLALIVYLGLRFWMSFLDKYNERDAQRNKDFAEFVISRDDVLETIGDKCHENYLEVQRSMEKALDSAMGTVDRNTEAFMKVTQQLARSEIVIEKLERRMDTV